MSDKRLLKLSDYVMQVVADQGVRHVFLVPGGGAMHLNDSLGRCTGLEFVSNLHEQASAIAAEAYARVTGNLGVAMVTTGPGGTNAVTGVAGAWLDSTACLFLSGQVKRPDIKAGTELRQLGVQEIDIVSIVQSITKYAVTVTDPQSIRFHLEKALHIAHSGRPGPVWVDIPLDVQAATIDANAMAGFTPEPPAQTAPLDLRDIAARTLDLLARSERPILFAGNGIRIAGAVELFQRLVETLRVPVQTTWLGLDLIADDHPLFAGRPGNIAPRGANFALQNSDFFLSVGARLDMAVTAYAHDKFARGAKKVIVDIDAAEIRKLGMKIDVPVVADARAFLEALLAEAERRNLPDYSDWIAKIAEWKQRYPLGVPTSSQGAGGLSAYAFSTALSDMIPEDALIVPGSSGFASEIFFLMLRIKRGQRCFHNRGTGAMGFAIPSAIGASLAAGGKQVITVDGDGGFQFNIQELATVAALDLPLKFFVINNQGYASIRASQNGYFGGNRVGCDATSGLVLPDLTRLADVYGIASRTIAYGDDLSAKIRAALEHPGPFITEVLVLHDEPREPRVASSRREDGSMVSKPLEDLFPFLERGEFLGNMIVPIIEE